MKIFLYWGVTLISVCLAQTVVYTTGPDGSVSAYLIAGNATSSTTATDSMSTTGTITTTSDSISSTASVSITSGYASTTPTTTLKLPTTPYTGQSMLTGTCTIPVYTALRFEKGNFIQVPLIGCSDDRPECCPSLEVEEVAATSTSTSQSNSSDTTATSSLTPTGIISMLSQAPLTVCPSDMVDIDPVCCPSGFTKWGQAILGNTPCASMLSTSYPLPSSVLGSITSSAGAAVSSSLAAGQSAEATQSVEIIANIVFALGLPCADDDEEEGEGGEGGEEGKGEEEEHKGLSTGAKAGIGAGVGAGVVIAIILGVWAFMRARRRKKEKAETLQAEQAGIIPQTTEYPAKMAMPPSSGGWSPVSTQDGAFAGYGQGFVDGVKAALAPPQPPAPPHSPPPTYGQPRMSYMQPAVEAPTEYTGTSRDRWSTQDHAAELSGNTSNATRSEM